MSVTFSLPSNETAYPDCPDCGANAHRTPTEEQAQCQTCYGYGADPVDSSPTLNCANGNAAALLGRLLGYEGPRLEELCGELEITDLRARLATAHGRIPTVVRSASSDGRVIDCGLSAEQCERYLERLTVMAEIASRRRESIRFG